MTKASYLIVCLSFEFKVKEASNEKGWFNGDNHYFYLNFLLKLKLDRPYLWFKSDNSKNGITISSSKCMIGFTWVISFPEIWWLVSTKKNAHFHTVFKWTLCGVITGLLPEVIPSDSNRLANSLSRKQIIKTEKKKRLILINRSILNVFNQVVFLST